MRILIAEDNFIVGLMIADELSERGHRVLGPASSSHHALKLIDSEQCDCALVDIDLADGRTGGMIARALAERGCSVVFVTGQAHLAQEWANFALGVLPKPVTPDEITAIADSIKTEQTGGSASWPDRLILF